MKKEYSAGGIVFKNGLVLLIRNYKPDKGVDYWGFPKGHLEQGETDEEAALREVEEETGIRAKIEGDIDYYEYFAGVNEQGEEIFKRVNLFLMAYLNGDIKPQIGELKEAKWLEPKEALAKLGFDNDKEVLSKVLKK